MAYDIIRDLENGLVIRHSTAKDTERLVQFNREIHGEDEWDRKGLEDWTRDLMSGGRLLTRVISPWLKIPRPEKLFQPAA